MDVRRKPITVKFPIHLLAKLTEIRTNEGISVTFQLIEGAKLYLKKREINQSNQTEME